MALEISDMFNAFRALAESTDLNDDRRVILSEEGVVAGEADVGRLKRGRVTVVGGTTQTRQNNDVRTALLKALSDQFDNQIPVSVREALVGSSLVGKSDMALDANGNVKSGRPLTMRRIRAVMTAAVNELAKSTGPLRGETKDRLGFLANITNIETRGAGIPKELCTSLVAQIENADMKTLAKMKAGFEQGNIDPCPHGQGARDIDLPKSIQDGFVEDVTGYLKGPGWDYETAAERILADIDREWTIDLDYVPLEGSKAGNRSVSDAKKDIVSKLNDFFGEEGKSVAPGLLPMINQHIYTPLVMDPFKDGTLPGGSVEFLGEVDKSISVSHKGDGGFHVEARMTAKNIKALMTVESQALGRCDILRDPASSYRETTVGYDVMSDGQGGWKVSFTEVPHVKYKYSKAFTQEEADATIQRNFDSLLASPDSLMTKMGKCVDEQNKVLQEEAAIADADVTNMRKSHNPQASLIKSREEDAVRFRNKVKVFTLERQAEFKLFLKAKRDDIIAELKTDLSLYSAWDEEKVLITIFNKWVG